MLCFLIGRGATAQTANVIDVNVIGIDYDFLDRYEFQGQAKAIKGVLKTGGFTTTYTVTNYVPEMRTKTEEYQVVVYIKGKRVVETRTRSVDYTVMVPVTEVKSLKLPVVKGYWYSLGDKRSSMWLVSSANSSGIVVGVGVRHGQQINGFITYLFTSRPRAGTYDVSPLLAP